MILIGNLLYGLGYVLSMALDFMIFVVVARAVLSWVSPDPFNPIVRFLVTSTDPLIRPIRRHMPNFGGIDLSPLILLLVLFFLKMALAQSLIDYGASIRLEAGLRSETIINGAPARQGPGELISDGGNAEV